MSKRAKTLSDQQFDELLQNVGNDSHDALRDYAILSFSFKAGLRACEIARIAWRDVTDAAGGIGTLTNGEYHFTVPAHVAKKGHARTIPMHPGLRAVLEALAEREGKPLVGNVIKGRYSSQVSPNTLQRYIGRLYLRHGLAGCSSHSGRRTLITKAVRIANQEGCSIFDVQSIAGHKYIDTTERYVELSDNVGALIRRM